MPVHICCGHPVLTVWRPARRYLLKDPEGKVLPQEVTIVNSRVVQKSYGSEKRFFCPPPVVQLTGARWVGNPNGAPCVFIGMGLNEPENDHQKVDMGDEMFGPARTLFISDQDKRKSFCLHVKIFYSNGRDIGTFTSKPVKVISKPSKKKQSLSNSEMCIESGTEVSLFNRVRAQAGSTRYLVGAHQSFTTDTKKWGTFRIRVQEGAVAAAAAAAAPGPPSSAHLGGMKAQYITYGTKVTLQCTRTNWISPVYVVRKVGWCSRGRWSDTAAPACGLGGPP